ncbi:hypothetical protein ABQY74_008600 [Xanthomonas sp. WHRI 7064]|uniref:hypothetical protein n=1 Tax=Xanthomonas sp. WHRI 7064 TaxID=3161568 RepID=UPI00355731F3
MAYVAQLQYQASAEDSRCSEIATDAGLGSVPVIEWIKFVSIHIVGAIPWASEKHGTKLFQGFQVDLMYLQSLAILELYRIDHTFWKRLEIFSSRSALKDSNNPPIGALSS